MKTGRWQAMTPEQQAGSIRHMSEEHLITEEVGKMAARAGVKTVDPPAGLERPEG
jgi:ribonuclease BN (tRNA processing enzyme)